MADDAPPADTRARALQITMLPAPGEHVAAFRGRALWVSRRVVSTGAQYERPIESLHLTLLARSLEVRPATALEHHCSSVQVSLRDVSGHASAHGQQTAAPVSTGGARARRGRAQALLCGAARADGGVRQRARPLGARRVGPPQAPRLGGPPHGHGRPCACRRLRLPRGARVVRAPWRAVPPRLPAARPPWHRCVLMPLCGTPTACNARADNALRPTTRAR